MPMSPWEYAFYKMAVLSIDTTKEPLKLCRKKPKTVFHDIPCPFCRAWNFDRFVIFYGEPTTLVLTKGKKALEKTRKERRGWEKSKKNRLYLYIYIYTYIHIYIYIYIYIWISVWSPPPWSTYKHFILEIPVFCAHVFLNGNMTFSGLYSFYLLRKTPTETHTHTRKSRKSKTLSRPENQ